jgi:hypothetical protein
LLWINKGAFTVNFRKKNIMERAKKKKLTLGNSKITEAKIDVLRETDFDQ